MHKNNLNTTSAFWFLGCVALVFAGCASRPYYYRQQPDTEPEPVEEGPHYVSLSAPVERTPVPIQDSENFDEIERVKEECEQLKTEIAVADTRIAHLRGEYDENNRVIREEVDHRNRKRDEFLRLRRRIQELTPQ